MLVHIYSDEGRAVARWSQVSIARTMRRVHKKRDDLHELRLPAKQISRGDGGPARRYYFGIVAYDSSRGVIRCSLTKLMICMLMR